MDGSRIFFAFTDFYRTKFVDGLPIKTPVVFCEGFVIIRSNGESIMYECSVLATEEDINETLCDVGESKVAKIFNNIGCFNP